MVNVKPKFVNLCQNYPAEPVKCEIKYGSRNARSYDPNKNRKRQSLTMTLNKVLVLPNQVINRIRQRSCFTEKFFIYFPTKSVSRLEFIYPRNSTIWSSIYGKNFNRFDPTQLAQEHGNKD